MRVNVYAEEMTDRVEIVSKEIGGETFTAVRFYLELPVTVPLGKVGDRYSYSVHRGPFFHHHGDDDSSAVTFWGKHDLRDSPSQSARIARRTLRITYRMTLDRFNALGHLLAEILAVLAVAVLTVLAVWFGY